MMHSYSTGDFVRGLIAWHYGRGTYEFVQIARNIFYFITHFFSFRLLIFTLLSPLSKISEPYTKRFDPGAFFSSLVINTIMRVVGFVARSMVLVMGLIAYLLTSIILLIIGAVWLLMPIVLVLLLLISINLLIP